MKKWLAFPFFIILFYNSSCAQPLQQKAVFTRQDTLRGSNTPERAWWNVLRYDITVTPDFNKRSISGSNAITFFDSGGYTMQIDLQNPMQVDSFIFDNKEVPYKRDGNVFFVQIRDKDKKYKIKPGPATLTVYFQGIPRPAITPPWDGGWIWSRDAKGRPWMSVACQGLGASVWYPCKDYQGDEPDSGASLTIHVPDTLVAIGNGRLKYKTVKEGKATYCWEVNSPINSYNIVPYIGKYESWSEKYGGENGLLDLSYYVLDYNIEKGKKQFEQAKETIKAFEYWFGPYPFYKDGYSLVEAPHLGMEHQSAVAYGNKFMNGYLGSDLSGTGWGYKWDYIIVHESGHEWFGNNITTKDIADMWVHEGFTDYSETLFIQYYYGKEAGNTYLQGLRKNIKNDKPIIGPYGVNQEGSGDMYYKGANLIHTIRQIINDDEKFRDILRGLNKTFYHQLVTTKQVEDYISQESGKDFSKVFQQYLRTAQIPILQIKEEKGKISFRWKHCIDGFNMPVKLSNGQWLPATNQWQEVKNASPGNHIEVDKNFYVKTQTD